MVVSCTGVKEKLISAIKLGTSPHSGGDMTADTTFKEFVEEKDLNFSSLDFGSPEYRSLVETFNTAKFQLEAEEEGREHEEERRRLMLAEQRAAEDLPRRRTRSARSNARSAASQP